MHRRLRLAIALCLILSTGAALAWVVTSPMSGSPPSVGHSRDATGIADVGTPAARLIRAARAQEGVTVLYDPAYVALSYPGGDVARDRGVCTDVVIRAYRDAFGLDLQKLVHDDMTSAFSHYPKRWGLKSTDSNIDHRRVPNLQVFFSRHGRSLPVSSDAKDYVPGDLVTQMIDGKLPHVAIVTGLMSEDGARPLVVHNIGRGTRLEDTLFAFPITGHYRYGLREAERPGAADVRPSVRTNGRP